LAHLFGEPGVKQVTRLFDEPGAEVNISALSIAEVYARLKAIEREDRWSEVWNMYGALFNKTLPADEAVAHQAIALRAATAHRLPTVDGLIAATASVHDLTLVHRDPHFGAIPPRLLKQTPLPDKA
jgi:predicted nucleic acid-binding protein